MRASIIATVFLSGFVGGLLAAPQDPVPAAAPAAALPAERVTGIGGIFLKARDPKALGLWYREKLGVDVGDGIAWASFDWRERGEAGRPGTTAWALFRSDSKYFEPSQATFMVNYRVRSPDRMLAQLRTLGVTTEAKIVEGPNGRFAWVLDPEGNKVELWEPKED